MSAPLSNRDADQRSAVVVEQVSQFGDQIPPTPADGVPARQLLTIREFAAVAGISAMTVYRLIHAGDFPAVRIGRRLFVPARLMEDLGNAAVAKGRVVTAADWQEARE